VPTQDRQFSNEEVARRGDEIYNRVVRSQVEQDNRGKVVAIDVETEEFEVGDNAIDASDKLLARSADAEIWFVRVGYRALHRIGGLGAAIEYL
jgi:succinyl-CoA synthetase beta subunit